MDIATTNSEHKPRSGWLHDLRLAIQYQHVKPQLLKGLLASLAMMTPIILGVLTGQASLGSVAGILALVATIVDPGGPLKQRLLPWFIAICGATLCFVVSKIAGQTLWSAAPFAFLVTFCSVLCLKWGRTGILCGSGLSVATIIGVSSPAPPAQALSLTIPAFLGGIWGITISLLLQPYQPTLVAKQSISAYYSQLASCFATLATYPILPDNKTLKTLGHSLFSSLQTTNHTLQTIQTNMPDQDSTISSYTELYTIAEHMTLLASALTEHLYTLRSQTTTTSSDTYLRETLYTVSSSLYTIASFNPHLYQLPLDHLITTISQHSRMQPASLLKHTLVDIQKNLILLQKQLHSAQNILQHLTTSQQFPLPSQTNTQSSKEDTSPTKPSINKHDIISIAFRLATAITIGVSLGIILRLPKPLWITMPIFSVLFPTLFSFSSTVVRTYQRTIGALLGAVLAIALIALLNDPLIVLAILALLLVGYGSFRTTQYAIAQLFMNPAMLLLTELGTPDNFRLVVVRIAGALIGCVIAFVTAYHLFPKPEFPRLRKRLAQAITANAHYLTQIFQNPSSPNSDLTPTSRKAALAAHSAQHSLENSQGEPIKWRTLETIYAHIIDMNAQLWTILTTLTSNRKTLSQSPQIAQFQISALNMLNEISATILQNEIQTPQHPEQNLIDTINQLQAQLDPCTFLKLQKVASTIDEMRLELGLLHTR